MLNSIVCLLVVTWGGVQFSSGLVSGDTDLANPGYLGKTLRPGVKVRPLKQLRVSAVTELRAGTREWGKVTRLPSRSSGRGRIRGGSGISCMIAFGRLFELSSHSGDSLLSW